jgi:hypothetical protein
MRSKPKVLGIGAIQILQFQAADSVSRALVRVFERFDKRPDSRGSRFVLVGLYVGAIAAGTWVYLRAKRTRKALPLSRSVLRHFTPVRLQPRVANVLQKQAAGALAPSKILETSRKSLPLATTKRAR